MAKYRSALRAEQAAQTRQRVVSAAAERFGADGYARTTLARLAEAAGVSVETVQAQGSKRSLLVAAVQQLSFGDSGTRVLSTAQAEAIFEASTPGEWCRRAADLVGELNSATYRLWRALCSAAADDPKVDHECVELSGFIRDECRRIVAELAATGRLRSDVDVDELGDSLWVLVGSENYDKVIHRLDWTHERYVAWLRRSLDDLLFRGVTEWVRQ